jgi:hypothetical protein
MSIKRGGDVGMVIVAGLVTMQETLGGVIHGGERSIEAGVTREGEDRRVKGTKRESRGTRGKGVRGESTLGVQIGVGAVGLRVIGVGKL